MLRHWILQGLMRSRCNLLEPVGCPTMSFVIGAGKGDRRIFPIGTFEEIGYRTLGSAKVIVFKRVKKIVLYDQWRFKRPLASQIPSENVWGGVSCEWNYNNASKWYEKMLHALGVYPNLLRYICTAVAVLDWMCGGFALGERAWYSETWNWGIERGDLDRMGLCGGREGIGIGARLRYGVCGLCGSDSVRRKWKGFA